MLRKIEELRTRPKAVRNRYAFLIATGFTGIVIVFWGLGLRVELQSLAPGNNAAPTDSQQSASGIMSTFNNLRTTWLGATSTTSSAVPPPAQPAAAAPTSSITIGSVSVTHSTAATTSFEFGSTTILGPQSTSATGSTTTGNMLY